MNPNVILQDYYNGTKQSDDVTETAKREEKEAALWMNWKEHPMTQRFIQEIQETLRHGLISISVQVLNESPSNEYLRAKLAEIAAYQKILASYDIK